MSDLTPGTTFSSGQIVTSEILNRLVNDASINDNVLKASNLSDDQIENIIMGQSTLANSDLHDEDCFLVWDVSESQFKKIAKNELTANLSQELTETTGLEFGPSNPSGKAIDLNGITTGLLVSHENFTINSNGSLYLASDEIHFLGQNLVFEYDSSQKRLFFWDPGQNDTNPPEWDWHVESRDAFHSARTNYFAPSQPGTNGQAVFRAKGDNDADGNPVFWDWWFISAHDDPQLQIVPENAMTDLDQLDPDYQEPRVVIKSDVYIADFDHTRVLPIQTDSNKSKLFVDEIYTMDGHKVTDSNGPVIDIDSIGGLELGENGLKLATSEESMSVVLKISTLFTIGGKQYLKGVTHMDRTGNVVTDKFLNMSDCYRWLSDNISSSRIKITIVHETDCYEPPYQVSVISNRDRNFGKIYHVHSQVFDEHNKAFPGPITTPLKKINISASSSRDAQYEGASSLPFWFEKSDIEFIGLYFNITPHPTLDYAIFRAMSCEVTFAHCKVKINNVDQSANLNLFDAIYGGRLRFTANTTYWFGGTPTDDLQTFIDPLSKYPNPSSNTERCHAFELETDQKYNNIFNIQNGSILEMLEFWARDGYTDLSGFHFSGNLDCVNFVYIDGQSTFLINTKISRNQNSIIQAEYGISSLAFNMLKINSYNEPSEVNSQYPVLPSTTEVIHGDENIDYRLTPGTSVINSGDAKDGLLKGGSTGGDNIPVETNYFA